LSLLRRGFKTWCENASASYRRELKLAVYGPLDPRALANHLGVLVWTPREVPSLDPAVLLHLTVIDPQSWSAVTLRDAKGNVIIVNDTHVRGRQNNSLSHEISHVILDHKAGQFFVTADGAMMMAEYNETQEEEADWLAGTLLVPRAALLTVLARGYDNERAADLFGVTTDLLQMRRNLTGVDLQLAGRPPGTAARPPSARR
jgi:hypothetical protein